jgi:cobalt-zinc-cadmium efflux system protein
MSSGHDHGGRSTHAGSLAWALGVLVIFAGVEITVALSSSSLSLLSDAGHIVTDIIGLTLALAAVLVARRSSPRHSFGLYRAEVLAALANAALLVGVAVFVVVEAVRRLSDPPEVAGLPVLLTAAGALGANLTAFLILRRDGKENINVRAAYLEVMADAVGSVGVLVGGALMLGFGWRWVDPVVAIAVGVFILPRTVRLARQALRILVQGVPAHLDTGLVGEALAELPGVQSAHDVHLWTLTSGMDIASAHVTITCDTDPVSTLTGAQRVLRERFGLDHVTVQVEPECTDCRPCLFTEQATGRVSTEGGRGGS